MIILEALLSKPSPIQTINTEASRETSNCREASGPFSSLVGRRPLSMAEERLQRSTMTLYL